MRQLKTQLWEHINPRISSTAAEQPEPHEEMHQAEAPLLALNMSDIMYEIYTSGVSTNCVTVNSAFICMLHLANEQTLRFERMDDTEADFRVTADVLA